VSWLHLSLLLLGQSGDLEDLILLAFLLLLENLKLAILMHGGVDQRLSRLPL
jgi:hypothetical protein